MLNPFKMKFALLLITAACHPIPTKTVPTHTPNKKESAMTIAPKDCESKLHKVTDRDDLIRQIYETAILEDCLYSIPNKELQAIWDIPVVTGEEEREKHLEQSRLMLDPIDIDSRLGLYVARYQHDNDKDVFVFFRIKLNWDLFEKQRTLFLEGHFPKFLGTPTTRKIETNPFKTTMRYPVYFDFPKYYQHMKDGFIKGETSYQWNINNKKIYANTYSQPIVPEITFTNFNN